MKLWLSKNSEIPIKDQIVTQVLVGIAAGDMKVGDKLPSTREIARRFGIHPNTVSSAYRELARNGHVTKRSGSGVFVAESNGFKGDALDGLIDFLLSRAESIGFGRDTVLQRLTARFQPMKAQKAFALFEPNPDLAKLIVHEVTRATGLRVELVEMSDINCGPQLIALSDEEPKLSAHLSEGSDCIYLTANSVALSMAGRTRPAEDDIVAVVSGWDDFLTLAKLFLIAASVDPDAIVSVSTKRRGWRSRLDAASLVICDSIVADLFVGDDRIKVFPIISAESLKKISNFAEDRPGVHRQKPY